MKSYHKQIEDDQKKLEKQLKQLIVQRDQEKNNDKWFKLQSQINAVRQSIKGKKERIRFHGKYPYMPETPELIHQLTR